MSQPSTPSFSVAHLQWDEEGRPISSIYQDVYFSRASGLEETGYVFLRHNGLPQRWQQLQEGQQFCIAETGFGTGLNFLASWQCWQEQAPEGARLHFISAEKHPLSREDLEKSLRLWPQLQELAQQLLEAWPPACSGYHRLQFDAGRITLTLLFGEAELMLKQLEARVDAWYLDGFAPARNPQMWSEGLFSAMARLSHTGTSFSTFTAAGIVRRGLTAAGFSVSKVPGFGHKRDMLAGEFSGPSRTKLDRIWYSGPQAVPVSAPEQRRAIVIGAGIAGCSAAAALARRGWQIELIDQASEPATAASGNAQGVLYAKLPAKPTLQSRIHLAGYLYSLRLLKQLLPDSEFWSPCGVLQLAMLPREAEKQQKLLKLGHYPEQLLSGVDADAASELAGVRLSHGGLWFPTSGWIHPPGLCRALISHPGIHGRFGQRVDQLQQLDDGRWQLLGCEGVIAEAPVVIVANAREAARFQQLQSLPLKSIRGQVSRFEQPDSPQEPLKTVLCGHSYISPPWQGQYCFGATFDIHSDDSAVRTEDHLENLNNTSQMAPELADMLAEVPIDQRRGRVGFRCTSPDYLPLVGAAVERDRFIGQYGELRNNARAQLDTPPPHLPGLYVSLAHGSKGMITAPLAGEIIASQISADPLPLEDTLLNALNPARFLVKDLIRRTI